MYVVIKEEAFCTLCTFSCLDVFVFLADTNVFTGSIPTEIGRLTNLETLILDGNLLSGNIPSTVGNLSSLNYFGLSKSAFTSNGSSYSLL